MFQIVHYPETNTIVYVVVQFYPFILGSNFYFLLFFGMAMYENLFETKENKIWTKDEIEHILN